MAFNPLWLQNIDYPARIDRTVFDNIWTEGVLGGGSLEVQPNAPANMTVTVAAGVATVTGDDQVFQGKYLVREQAVTTGVTITAAPGTGTRHDLVVLKVRDPNASGAAGDDAVIQVVTGVASGSPVDPAVPASALVLARVRVAAGTGSITSVMIDDLRVQARVIGATSPSGSIMQFAGSTPPDGWLLCDGTAVSQTVYSDLFAVIGGTYNTSGGQLTPSAGLFRTPLLTGRVPVGRDATQTEFDVLGETGGAKTHTLGINEMPLHTHIQNSHNHTQDAHNHTQNSHNHSQNSHNHTQDAHGHGVGNAGGHNHTLNTSALDSHDHYMPARQTSNTTHSHTGVNTVAAGFSGTDALPFTSAPTATISPSANAVGDHAHGLTNTTATNQAITATNIATTASNIATTASNQATTAVNQTTGASLAHNNLQPYIVLNYIIKT